MRLSLEQAAHLLKNGEVVAVPTETVYGLAASLSAPSAINRVFTLKNRPPKNPLIIHLASASDLAKYQTENLPHADLLAQRFWPGPMTLIVPVDSMRVPDQVRASLPTAAFRIPRHPLALELLQQTGPLVMPSANLSGRPSATYPEHVEEDFGKDFPVLDGGSCSFGLESTILSFQQGRWVIVRQGALAPQDFYPIIGYVPEVKGMIKGEIPICPGQLFRHYAPKAKLILAPQIPESCQVIVGFEDRRYPDHCRVFYLGALSQPEEVGHNLYQVLRQLDHEGVAEAWVDMNFERKGVMATVAERLSKAAQT